MPSSVSPVDPNRPATDSSDAAGVANALRAPQSAAWSPAHAQLGSIYAFDSLDPRSRSFNLIRGRLLELKRLQDVRLIGVVSATPNVGKSFVAANISASVSRDPGVNAFAIDLDLRRGSLSRQFGIDPTGGLTDHLERGSPLEAYRLEGEALTVVPARGGLVHSAELLAAPRAQILFETMRASDPANLFICDLPPVFANDDAVATMARLDNYILVSEEGRTTERELREAVDALGRQKLAGVVLNKFRGGLVSDGYGVQSYYTAGYGAGEDESR